MIEKIEKWLHDNATTITNNKSMINSIKIDDKDKDKEKNEKKRVINPIDRLPRTTFNRNLM